MRIALILVPVLAALSLTSAFQSPTKPADRPASVAKATQAVAAIMTPDLNAGAVIEQCNQF
jgi:hypothetical protein